MKKILILILFLGLGISSVFGQANLRYVKTDTTFTIIDRDNGDTLWHFSEGEGLRFPDGTMVNMEDENDDVIWVYDSLTKTMEPAPLVDLTDIWIDSSDVDNMNFHSITVTDHLNVGDGILQETASGTELEADGGDEYVRLHDGDGQASIGATSNASIEVGNDTWQFEETNGFTFPDGTMVDPDDELDNTVWVHDSVNNIMELVPLIEIPVDSWIDSSDVDNMNFHSITVTDHLNVGDGILKATVPGVELEADGGTEYIRLWDAPGTVSIAASNGASVQIGVEVWEIEDDLIRLADEDTLASRAYARAVAGGAGGVEFSDAEFNVHNSSDATKILDFDVSNFTTGNTRTMSFPNRDAELFDSTEVETTTFSSLSVDDSLDIGPHVIRDNTSGLEIEAEGGDEYLTLGDVSGTVSVGATTSISLNAGATEWKLDGDYITEVDEDTLASRAYARAVAGADGTTVYTASVTFTHAQLTAGVSNYAFVSAPTGDQNINPLGARITFLYNGTNYGGSGYVAIRTYDPSDTEFSAFQSATGLLTTSADATYPAIPTNGYFWRNVSSVVYGVAKAYVIDIAAYTGGVSGSELVVSMTYTIIE